MHAERNAIPEPTKQWVDGVVKEFNERMIGNPKRYFTTRYRRQYLYLDRFQNGVASPICRLTYTGDLDDWEFAIFKYSTEKYDPEEWLFPGSGHLDGTIQGALKAGMEAYP